MRATFAILRTDDKKPAPSILFRFTLTTSKVGKYPFELSSLPFWIILAAIARSIRRSLPFSNVAASIAVSVSSVPVVHKILDFPPRAICLTFRGANPSITAIKAARTINTTTFIFLMLINSRTSFFHENPASV
jgi:hypothetical protein